MKAAVLHGQNDIRVEEVPIPAAGPDDILVKVMATGICGSDLPRVLGRAAHHYPIVLGHEFAGIVERVGAAVTRFKPGDRVAGAPLKPCMVCEDCGSGHYAQCAHYSFIGSRENGSWAEYVTLPARNAIPFDADIGFEEAAFVEPSAVALHALQLIGFQGGGRVAILGGGNIGLLTLQWALILGAREVTVFDIDEDRLATARQLGAAHVIDTRQEHADREWKRVTAGRGFDVVMETAGAEATMRMSFDIAANKAQLCFIGTPTRPLTYPPEQFERLNRKELTLTGSWMSYSAPFPGGEWEMTIHYLRNGRLRVKPLIDRTFALRDIREAFDLYERPGLVKGKIMLLPQQ